MVSRLRPHFKIVKWLCSLSVISVLVGLACSDQQEFPPPHPVAYDLEPLSGEGGKTDGLTDRFDPEWLMSDLFFLNTSSLSAKSLQTFFEESPYQDRSWLADYRFGQKTAAEMIVSVAYQEGVNPLLLLSRMQVEQSLISRPTPPSTRVMNAAMGCGCHDGASCIAQFKGMEKQLKCAASTLRDLFEQSRSGQGIWQAGQSKRTLDPLYVQPANHATAAMYAYTPWVLKGRGGNWLAWNVMRKFVRFLQERNLVGEFDEVDLSDSASLNGGVSDNWSEAELASCLYSGGRAFVGEPCGCQRDCDFWSGKTKGFCHPAGFCSLECQGGCPDVLNKAQTFCIEDPEELGLGICVSKASELNGHCADLPDTIDMTAPRFIGNSNAAQRDAEVCAPR